MDPHVVVLLYCTVKKLTGKGFEDVENHSFSVQTSTILTQQSNFLNKDVYFHFSVVLVRSCVAK